MEQATIQKLALGTILSTSWGYDMTINEYCEVLEDTGKTVLCRMVGKTGEDGWQHQGKVWPNKDYTEGKPFRLRTSVYQDRTYYSGKYPYVVRADGSEYKHSGTFQVWDGNPDWENHMD